MNDVNLITAIVAFTAPLLGSYKNPQLRWVIAGMMGMVVLFGIIYASKLVILFGSLAILGAELGNRIRKKRTH